MFLHQDLDAKVAARRTDVAQLALVSLLEPHAALDARRDVHLEMYGARHSARAPAAWAGIGDPDPFAAAGRASGRDLEEAAGLDDLAAAAAIVAGRRDGPLAGPRPVAFAAKLLAVHVDRARRPASRLDQLDLQLQQQVGTGPRPAAPIAEEVAEQPAAEDVAEGRHDVVGRPEVVERRAVQAGMAIAVVSLPLVRIGKDLVSFGRFLESLRGLVIARIAVRMILQRHLSIGFLDLLDRGVAADPEDFVKIALRGGHRHGVSVD